MRAEFDAPAAVNDPTEFVDLNAVADRLDEVLLQAECALRHVRGLPLAVVASDTASGRRALLADNGLFGVGEIAIETGEFSPAQLDAIAALGNNMAALASQLPGMISVLRRASVA